MDVLQKIDLLGQAAEYDICTICGNAAYSSHDELSRYVFPAMCSDGRRVKLLKVLQTNACDKDCAYCTNRSGRDTRRTRFTPDELARTFDALLQRGRVEGLFLSSGVYGGVGRATDQMLATIELVRRRYHFGGYIHAKILPGADDASIEASIKMANRVSINLEAPTPARLGAIAPSKSLSESIGRLRKADALRRNLGRKVSMTTQFVVGAAQESDQEILSICAQLYGSLRLARIYYSAFRPIRDTPLENHPPAPLWRTPRLYQADALMRMYGFGYEDIPFDEDGDLSRHVDPKLLWAQRHPEFFPIEVNTASHRDLLRIPGIGPKSAGIILSRRKQGTLRTLEHIGLPRVSARRAAPFVLLNGRQPTHQLSFWDEQTAVG